MQKLFKTQSLMSKIYIGITLCIFAYSLYFMTDYADLFGLLKDYNAGVIEFHDSLLQTFNQVIFFAAVFQVILFIVALVLETGKKVPDKFALIVLTPMLAIVIAASIYALIRIPALVQAYNNVDFSNMHREIPEMTETDVYEHKYATFNLGYAVYVLNIVASILFGFVLIKSHLTFVKSDKDVR